MTERIVTSEVFTPNSAEGGEPILCITKKVEPLPEPSPSEEQEIKTPNPQSRK